jgi:hypothetical protein
MARVVSPSRVSSAPVPMTDFYREEFLKHRQCLAQQREYYSERAITDVDAAIARILNRLEHLCSKDDADQLMSGLLRKFNSVTGLSAWSDPSKLH